MTTARPPLDGGTRRKLVLDDIADARAYERERAEFRTRVIALKRRRRISLGPVVTVVFENRDTVRFQVQEMARAERILDDAGVQVELDMYNPMIPEPGELSATMFLELTSDEQVREWLPKLVGIERSLQFQTTGDGESPPLTLRAVSDEQHAARLTRDSVTSAVHYVRFVLTPDEIETFARATVELVVDHPGYAARQVLSDETKAELLTDLRA
jgi:hypothetical protein